MYRPLLIKVNSKEIFQFCKCSIQCLNVFTKVLEDHRIPTNIDINERLWTGWFGANGTSLSFICKNRSLYLGTTVKLWTYWMYFSIKFFPFLLLLMKKKLLWFEFVLAIFLGPRTKVWGPRIRTEGRGSRNTNTHFLTLNKISYYFTYIHSICRWRMFV